MRVTEIVEQELFAARTDYAVQAGWLEKFRHRNAEDQVFLSPGLFSRLLEEKGITEGLDVLVVDGPMVIFKDDTLNGQEHVTILVRSHFQVTRTYQERDEEYERFTANNSSNSTPVPSASGSNYSRWEK